MTAAEWLVTHVQEFTKIEIRAWTYSFIAWDAGLKTLAILIWAAGVRYEHLISCAAPNPADRSEVVHVLAKEYEADFERLIAELKAKGVSLDLEDEALTAEDAFAARMIALLRVA